MENFTNRLKKLFNIKGAETQQSALGAASFGILPKVLSSKGKTRMSEIFFVRSAAEKNLFIHPDGKDLFQPVYALKESTNGAVVFTNEMAELLIIERLANNGEVLQKISFDQAKKEGAL